MAHKKISPYKEIVLYIIVFGLSTLNIYQSLRIQRLRINNNYSITFEDDFDRLSGSLLLSYLSTRETIPSFDEFLKYLVPKIDLKLKVFVRISEYSCQSCIDNLVVDVNKLCDNIGPDRIVLVSSYSNEDNRNVILSKFNENIRTISYRNGIFINDSDIYNPTIFVMGNKKTPRKIYYYQKELADFNREYFYCLEQEFQNNNF